MPNNVLNHLTGRVQDVRRTFQTTKLLECVKMKYSLKILYNNYETDSIIKVGNCSSNDNKLFRRSSSLCCCCWVFIFLLDDGTNLFPEYSFNTDTIHKFQ